MKGLLDLFQLRNCFIAIVSLVFLGPLSAQFSTVSHSNSDFYNEVSDPSQQVFKKIQFKIKTLRLRDKKDHMVNAKQELELYYLTTLALKISGGIRLDNAIESNYHDLIAHARLVGQEVDLELLVFDILSYLQ